MHGRILPLALALCAACGDDAGGRASASATAPTGASGVDTIPSPGSETLSSGTGTSGPGPTSSASGGGATTGAADGTTTTSGGGGDSFPETSVASWFETTTGLPMDCEHVLYGTLRDFQESHPDFEYMIDVDPGIVQPELGPDKKPVYAGQAGNPTTTGQANFDQWYRDVPEVNLPYFVSFSLAPSNGTYTFSSEEFFPLDGAGYGKEGLERNFGFTTEVHTKVAYNGGETFTFTGDDDLWVFINDTLAIDLGGLHSSKTKTVHLDEIAGKLGIEKGKTYGLDLFHAERHSTASHFRIETTLEFTDCGTFVPSDPK